MVSGRLIVTGTAQVLLAFAVALASAVRTAERRARVLGMMPENWTLAPAPATDAHEFHDGGESMSNTGNPVRNGAPSSRDDNERVA